ncbi:uncharacterized protein CTRU02_208306 [Colletotrichum truncatum]|uniref:Uncharacterized protein n=1 Tax=Colletotrichum truncatum TaxID=5467 RepID=A0ACC3YVX1_COLTU|nr:uncharacterized protein CTRU02_07513 [Colletotrichum truncatum]KAF6791173.1 hypothetical protein CTRU02_07513 [Colletotrichum truncatum]
MPHQYPGLGLPLRHFPQNEQLDDVGIIYPMGIDTNCWYSDSAMLLVREVAMMIVMDKLTEKADWHTKVFDDAIASKWIEEGLAMPSDQLYDTIVKGKFSGYGFEHSHPKRLKQILNRPCLEYCIKELRAKAEFFKKSGLVPTLDASATVVKSDSVVDESLQQELRAAFTKLLDAQKDCPDFHPGTDGKVRNLVHPSLYPLVYGKTRVFQEEVVGVEDAIDTWAGKGEPIPEPEKVDARAGMHRTIGGSMPPANLWSENYQWLPSVVKIQDDGSVKFTSYINNLHPIKHRAVYQSIERLIEKALPAWDLCIISQAQSRMIDMPDTTAGRTEPRFPLPDSPDDENEDNWDVSLSDIQLPDAPSKQDDEAEVEGDDDDDDDESDEESDYHEEEDEQGIRYGGTRREILWKKTRQPVQPEVPPFKAWNYGAQPKYSLRERYKDLQVIVKMASIELTPEKPSFPAGSWHVEGQINERIIATALYYLDSENITTSHLDFRMQTSSYQDDLQDKVGQDAYGWLEMVYGTSLSGSPCIQNYGSVETKEGRLLAFPNTFQHRVSPFELKDKTKPGHRRFIAIWLVDPVNRVISTANVPPQQRDWWMDRAFSGLRQSQGVSVPQSVARLIAENSDADDDTAVLKALAEGKDDVPPELFDMIRKHFGDWSTPMGRKEALEHRLKLMEERSNSEATALDGWFSVDYNFCEH